jgi:hypothetical protein
MGVDRRSGSRRSYAVASRLCLKAEQFLGVGAGDPHAVGFADCSVLKPVFALRLDINSAIHFWYGGSITNPGHSAFP